MLEWQEFYRTNPFGLDRQDYMLARIAHTQACTWASEPPSFDMFMPDWGAQPKTEQEQNANLENACVYFAAEAEAQKKRRLRG